MECWQRDHIQRHLPDLFQQTLCTEIFLSYFIKEGVLSNADLDIILGDSINISQCKKFYDFIQARRKAFELLTKSLYITHQTGALAIVLEGFAENKISCPFKKCNIELNTKIFLDKRVNFQGKCEKLGKICSHISDPVLQSIFEGCMDGGTYFDLIEEKLILMEDTLPELPPYYISRTLSCRNQLSPDIFRRKIDDVFVFTGMTWSQLADIAGPDNFIDRSSTQRLELTVRFILLEDLKEFDDICDIATVSVHLIQYELPGKTFSLKKSKGCRNGIADKLVHSQNISENQLVNDLLENPQRHICIADTAGMGKSKLLAKISLVMSDRKQGNIFIFIGVREFIQYFTEFDLLQVSDDVFINRLFSKTSPTILGTRILYELVKTFKLKIELLLDGYDELENDERSRATGLTQYCVNNISCIRITITTRPHDQNEVESILGTVSYEIEPFQEIDQIAFLEKYWEKELGLVFSSKLHEFSELCIKDVKAKLDKFERKIAGIPLLCKLIAENFKNEAKKYCTSSSLNSAVFGHNLGFTSLYLMFKSFVSNRIQRQAGNHTINSLYLAHQGFALKEVFPSWFSRYRPNEPLPTNDLYKFGIVEQCKNENESQFIHRSFAEYFVAEYIIEIFIDLCSKNVGTSDPTRLHRYYILLFNLALKSCCFSKHHTSFSFDGKTPKYFAKEKYFFKHDIISYFINAHLYNQKHILSCIHGSVIDSYSRQVDHIYALMASCARNDYLYIFRFVKKIFGHGHTTQIHDKNDCVNEPFWYNNVLLPAAKNCSLQLLREVVDFIEQLFGESLENICIKGLHWHSKHKIPLHKAVKAGKCEIVHYLLSKYSDEFLFGRFLLHDCVRSSRKNPDEIVSRKCDIVKMILHRNKKLLEEKNDWKESQTPIFVPYIHLELLKCLIDAGADITLIYNNTGKLKFPYHVSSWLMRDEYIILANFIRDKGYDSIYKQMLTL